MGRHLIIVTILSLMFIPLFLLAVNRTNSNNMDHINTITSKNDRNDAMSAELVNFRFECGKIKWSTTKETNCSHFLVMFSRDNKSWNILGQVYGAGNSTQKNNYSYPTDLKDVYFKLYQIDFDGDMLEFEPVYGSCKK